MSLATRCPSCGTIFRVVQDQLKVCEGWVRCGRCDEVFSALEGLFDLERDPPPDWSPGLGQPTAAPELRATTESDIATDEPPRGPALQRPSAPVDEAPHEVLHERPYEPPHEPPYELPYQHRDAEATGPADNSATRTQFAQDSIATTLAQAHESSSFALSAQADSVVDDDALSARPGAAAADADADTDTDASAEATPGFLRRAHRQARWQRPAVRAGLGIAAVALLAVLAGQAVHHFRDAMVARWPESRPALTAWCGAVGCSIGAPRHIDAVSVESSALNRAAAPNSFKLALTLRNRSSVGVAVPAVELTLTDAAGQMVARRALMPRDFRVTAPVIAPGAETPMQLVLGAGSPRVTGYTVELFYP